MKAFHSLSALCICALLTVSIPACTTGDREDTQREEILNEPAAAPVQQEHTIEIAAMKFVPAEITVRKGDKITFVNNDMVTHDITEDPGKSWSSSMLPAGGSWSLTVTESAAYYCTLHPTMRGMIIVK